MQFKDSTRTTLSTAVKFLSPDIALVHSNWRISGDRSADGSLLPQPRLGAMTRVVVRRNGTWEVVAAHNTNTIPNP
jgi:ketosteroid isomerase-like protein